MDASVREIARLPNEIVPHDDRECCADICTKWEVMALMVHVCKVMGCQMTTRDAHSEFCYKHWFRLPVEKQQAITDAKTAYNEAVAHAVLFLEVEGVERKLARSSADVC